MNWQLDPEAALGPRRTDTHLRLLEASIEYFSKNGVLDIAATDIIKFSGLSRTYFYHAFENVFDCFVASHRISLIEVEVRIANAVDREQSWQAQLKQAIDAVIKLFQENSDLARLILLEAPIAGPFLRGLYRETTDRLTASLALTLRQAISNVELTQVMADIGIGAARQLLASVATDDEPVFHSLGPDLFTALTAGVFGYPEAKKFASTLAWD